MHGNVWEWCRDVYSKVLPVARDPEVTTPGSQHSARGGSSENFTPFDCESSSRMGAVKGDSGIGFRLALSRVTQRQ